MNSNTFVALSVMSVSIPPSLNPAVPADTQMVAIGMFAAHVSRDGRRWRFLNRAAAAGAGERDEPLLRWLAENLPASATIIGWQFDSHVLPVLTSAASTAMPGIASTSMQRLSEALLTPPIDLARDVGGAAARPLMEVAADHCVGMPPVTDEQRISSWSFGETDVLEVEAADVALGIWQLFLRMSALAGLEAEEATQDWIQRRRQIRAVPSRTSDHNIRHEVAVRMKKTSSFGHTEGDNE